MISRFVIVVMQKGVFIGTISLKRRNSSKLPKRESSLSVQSQYSLEHVRHLFIHSPVIGIITAVVKLSAEGRSSWRIRQHANQGQGVCHSLPLLAQNCNMHSHCSRGCSLFFMHCSFAIIRSNTGLDDRKSSPVIALFF